LRWIDRYALFYDLDIYDLFRKMDRNNIILSFKGEVTSELLTSILQIMENKLDDVEQNRKVRKKVYNILVECLQNLYHHIEDIEKGEVPAPDTSEEARRSAIFMIGKEGDHYSIITGNFILKEEEDKLRERIDRINAMTREELKDHYKEVLNNGKLSEKGGGGLGMIDIAKKSGQKLDYSFTPLDGNNSFFSLNVKVAQ
jgi:hypothetical protein